MGQIQKESSISSAISMRHNPDEISHEVSQCIEAARPNLNLIQQPQHLQITKHRNFPGSLSPNFAQQLPLGTVRGAEQPISASTMIEAGVCSLGNGIILRVGGCGIHDNYCVPRCVYVYLCV